MFVPFSVNDFLDRAVTAYGDRIGVIDEPVQPAPALGRLTYRQIGELARRQAAKLDELGIGVGERVAIIGGENVSSVEVEDALFSHPAVTEVCVIGVPSEKWGETIKALVVLAPDSDPTDDMEAELIRWCKSRLAGFKAPTSVEFRHELTRTATGKLQKFKLRAQYWNNNTRSVN